MVHRIGIAKMDETKIGRRIKALREGAKQPQDLIARVLGVNERQTVGQIENGSRRLTADELLKIIDHFKISLEDITNPFLLFETESFSWRQHNVAAADLEQFEKRAGEWVGAYRELGRLGDVRLKRLLPRLGLTYQSSASDAVNAGEAVASELQLGEAPALELAETMESKLGILVLMADTIPGVSGAACRLPEMNAVIVNRCEPLGRRNFDLAHELFHLLTWDVMKPEHVESNKEDYQAPKTRAGERNQRIERLANAFASGLLLPTSALEKLGRPRSETDAVEWLTYASAALGVSGSALKWRLVNSKYQEFGSLKGVSDEALASAARARTPSSLPLLFSKIFMQTIASAIEAGHISARRASRLLGLTIDEIENLCSNYGISLEGV